MGKEKKDCKYNLFDSHYFIAFFTTLIVSMGLFITSFFIPPKGKVDESVLKGMGEALLWPALAFGAKAVEEGRTLKWRNGESEMTLGRKDKKEDEEEEVEE